MHIVAHRGYSGKFPELSPIAFSHALDLPIHGIECDIQLTRDGKVMVNHDFTLDRTSDRSGRIAQMEWADIRTANIGGEDFPDQRPLLLDDLLEMVAPTNHHIYIETKHRWFGGDELERTLVACLRAAGLAGDPRVHVIAFSHAAMRRMAQVAPDIDRIYLRRDWERRVNPRDVLLSQPTGLGLSLLSGKFRASTIGSHGLPTYMWTVDDPADIRWARDHGVDILATNEPEVALQALAT